MIKYPFHVSSYEGGWTCIRDSSGQILCKQSLSGREVEDALNFMAEAANAFHEAGIQPGDLPKFIRAVCDMRAGYDILASESVREAHACLPPHEDNT